MPELPEVETIRRQLEKEIKGATIKNVVVRSSKPLNVSAKKFVAAVRGAKIKEVGRRAKLLLLYLKPIMGVFVDTNTPIIVAFHLKMTGRMLLAGKKEPPTKHTHIVFELSGGRNLFFEDYRKFGFVKLLKENDLEKYLACQGYGPEPFAKNFSYATMKACLLAHKNKRLKDILMDQTCIAGIGNIYAAEICFFAKVRPDRKIADITEAEFKKIYDGTKKILADAIANRGTSADAYVDAYGKQGTFVPKLKVYDREGEKCLRCGGIVKKEKLGGRGTYWCPACQK